MGKHELWTTIPTEGEESIRCKDKKEEQVKAPAFYETEPRNPTPGGGFWNRLRKVANVCLNLLLWGVMVAAGWYGHQVFSAPDFSQMKAQFEIDGHAQDGERLAELGKICRNDAGTPMACQVLYFSRAPELAMKP